MGETDPMKVRRAPLASTSFHLSSTPSVPSFSTPGASAFTVQSGAVGRKRVREGRLNHDRGATGPLERPFCVRWAAPHPTKHGGRGRLKHPQGSFRPAGGRLGIVGGAEDADQLYSIDIH